jgi:CheY-like chemotaxis protein
MCPVPEIPTPRADPTGAPITVAKNPCRVLVADDSPVNRKIIQRMFERLGYEPAYVANGREAVDALHLAHVDLVLMDVEMPVMDGIIATQTIRREIHDARQPVIVGLTAHTGEGTRERLIAAGMDDYLAKPFSSEQLSALMLSLPTLRPTR